AVGAAREERKALLVLVHRGDADVPLVFVAATWGAPAPRPATEGVPGVPSAPVAATAKAPPPPPPPPLPPDAAGSVAGAGGDTAGRALPATVGPAGGRRIGTQSCRRRARWKR